MQENMKFYSKNFVELLIAFFDFYGNKFDPKTIGIHIPNFFE